MKCLESFTPSKREAPVSSWTVVNYVMLIRTLHSFLNRSVNMMGQPVKLCIKIDLVSYPAQAEGLVNMNIMGQCYNRNPAASRVI